MYPPTTFLGTITIVLFPISQPLVRTRLLLFLGQLQLLCFPFPNPWYVPAYYFSWDNYNYFVSHFPTLGTYPPTTFLGTIAIILFPISQPLVRTRLLLFLGQLQLFCFPFPNPWYIPAYYFSWDNYNYFVSHFPTLGMYWHITFLGTISIILFPISKPYKEEVYHIGYHRRLIPVCVHSRLARAFVICTHKHAFSQECIPKKYFISQPKQMLCVPI